MSVEYLQIDPDAAAPDSVSGILDEMNGIGLEGLQADWPEKQTLDIGLEAARFGSQSSRQDRLTVVVGSPYGNQLHEHRMVLADMQHRQLVAATNGEQEIDLVVVAAPAGKTDIRFGDDYKRSERSPNSTDDQSVLSHLGREILGSLHRGGHISGRIVLAGPSLAGAMSLATGSDEQVRKSFDVKAIGDYMDPRITNRAEWRLGWQFFTSGGEFDKDVDEGGLTPYKEALALHTQSEFVSGILRQWRINKLLMRDLTRSMVYKDLSNLYGPGRDTLGVPVSSAHVVLAAGTKDKISPYSQLADQVQLASDPSSREFLGLGSTTLIEVVDRGHTAFDNPAVYAEVFSRTMQPLIEQEA